MSNWAETVWLQKKIEEKIAQLEAKIDLLLNQNNVSPQPENNTEQNEE